MSTPTIQPLLEPADGVRFELGGVLGTRLRAAIDGWLLPAPPANPAMLQMFRDRDRLPRRNLLPWSGEFIGKHLTAGTLVWRLTRDTRLRASLAGLVAELIAAQGEDGYLGAHPTSVRLVGETVEGGKLWDVWGHYHCILGLLLWHKEAGDAAALEAAVRAGDCVWEFFYGQGRRLGEAGAEEMNMAISHGFCLLHRATGEDRFLQAALEVVRDWEKPPAGDYLRVGLAGTPFWKTPKPRWESLHDLQALAELCWITGDEDYRRAFEQHWWSILEGDRHNTGGFTSGEKAVGNPYDPHAIETCCTISWAALSVDMLRLTGNSLVADELELSLYNGILGGQHPTGRWWTYNTPMDGVKKASAHDINFQCREGSPELNCCSVNAPRGLGMLADWAVMQSEAGLTVNYYGPGTVAVRLPSGAEIKLEQTTEYPRAGEISLRLRLSAPVRFPLALRIPTWSRDTSVQINTEGQQNTEAGRYLTLEREWHDGDVILLSLDMSPHFWVGERECTGQASIYRGPLLLAYDRRYNDRDPDDVPTLAADALEWRDVRDSGVSTPWALLELDTEGGPLRLCDFASAGMDGTPYRSWLPMTGLPAQPFDRARPVWAHRP